MRRALIVGIEEFEDERFAKLLYPTKDAKALAKAISGFDDVTVLTGRAATSRSAILAALHALAGRVRHRDDTLLVYFSTHGSLDRKPGGELERFIVTADTRLDIVSATALSVSELVAALNRTESRRVALILATCHSGGGKSQISDTLAVALRGIKAPALAPIEVVSEASFVLSASAIGEAAREDDQLGHDVYTHFLLEAMRLGDRDEDGAVTVSEAHDYARERTYQFTQGRQRPSAESVILGVDPIELVGRRSRVGRPTIYSYAPSADGLVVSVDGARKGTLPGGVAVEAGRRKLELLVAETGERIYEGSIQLEPGERADLSLLLPPPPELSLRVGPSFFFPTSAGARERYFPTSYGLRLAFRAEHLGWRDLVLEVGADWVLSSGRTAEANSGLPYDLSSLRPGVRVGLGLPLGSALSLEATAGVGALFAWRSFETASFEAQESLRGPWLSGRFALIWATADWLRLSLELEPGAFWGVLGEDSGPHAFLGAALLAGLRF